MNQRIRLGVLVTGCLIAAAACGSTSESSSTAGTTLAVDGLTPAATQSVDTVTWALTDGEPATLDPLGTVDYSPNTVVANMCESLLRTNPDLSTSPALASDITQPDDTTFVITLREGVTFWNGDPLTADDVVYSLKRFADPENGSGWIVSYLNVESIEATGPLEVTVELAQPDVMFRSTLAAGGTYISQQRFVEAAGPDYGSPSRGLMCTGPFEFVSWSSGDTLVMKRNADYWDASLQPKVNELVFRFIDDDSTLLSALRSGEVDGAYGLSPQVLRQAEDAGVGAGYATPGLQQLQLFLVAQPDNPLADLRIRQAWRAAQDFTGIADGIFRGTAVPAAAVVGPATWGYERNAFQQAYDALEPPATDLEAAKQLVAEAGAPLRPIVLATPAGGASEQVALAAQSAGEAVGIPVTLRKMPATEFATLFWDPAARVGIDALVVQGYSDFPEPAAYYSFFRKGEYYNYFEYDSPEFDTLITQALRTYDDKARAELVAKAQAGFMEDLPTIPIAFMSVTLFMNARISGAPAGWAYMTSPWAAYLGGS